MARDHHTSMRLEVVARSALGIQTRGGLGGIIDADFIDGRGAFTVLCATLSPYYVNANPKTQEKIGEFIGRYFYLTDDISDEEYFEGVNNLTNELKALIDELSHNQ